MGRAQDDIQNVGVVLHDFRQCFDHIFDALVCRQKAEGQNDEFPLGAKLILVEARIDEGNVMNTMRDQIDLFCGHAVHFLEQLDGALAHHSQAVGELDDLLHHPVLLGKGIFQDGVQRGHHRRGHIPQQGQDIAARLAAIDPKFMLQADDVHGLLVQKVSGMLIIEALVLGDLITNLAGIGIPLIGVVHGQCHGLDLGELFGKRLGEIGREGCNAAFSGQVVSNKCNPF